jgi:translation elongation factor EF-Tu-like GTPase
MQSDIYVNARLKLYSTNEGGRKTGIKTNYRPNHVFEYTEGQILSTFIGEIQFTAKEWINPGEGSDVTIRFLNCEPLLKYLKPGRKWWIHEASKRIGEAEIIKVL